MPDKSNCRGDNAPVTRREMDQAWTAIADNAEAIGAVTEAVSRFMAVVEDRLGCDDGEYDDDDDAGDDCAEVAAIVAVAADPAWATIVGELADVLLAPGFVLDAALAVMAGGGALSYHVADEIAGGAASPAFTRAVARILGQLANDGKIVRLRPRSGTGPLVWWPVGVPLPAEERREYVQG